jgi:hypothetical protein
VAGAVEQAAGGFGQGEEDMAILRIHHSVPTFDAWKRAFDRDPVGRRSGGVRGYSVGRSVTDPNYVTIDLEFEAVAHAEAFLEKLKVLWSGAARDLMRDPQAWVIETIESGKL